MRIALASIALVLAGRTAEADVTWTAPASCPSAADVRARIDDRLGDLSIEDVGAIEVSVTRTGKQFTAMIDTRAITVAGNGRTLTAARCDELADAVALIVARLASEAADDHHDQRRGRGDGGRGRGDGGRGRGDGRRRSERAPVASFAIEVPHETLAVTLPVPRERPQPATWTGGFRALALTGIGMTPSVGVGADLSMFVQRDTAFAELGYARWVPRPMQILASVDGAVEFDLQLVALRAGWASTRMPLRGWAGLEVGQMHGAGPALRTPASGVGRWVAISSGFGVGWPISPRTRLVGTFEVAVPIQRAEFEFMDGSEVREPAPISARSALGLEHAWR